MKNPTFLFIFILLHPITSIASPDKEIIGSKAITTKANILETLPVYSTTYDPKRDAFKDGTAAVELATKTNRRILIELGGDWCSWCHKMDAFFDKNPDLKQKLHETFVMLKVNVNSENDNAEFLKSFPKASGYPHMYVSEYNGSVLWSKDTADFVKNGQYSREAFVSFFDRWHIKNKQ